MTPFVVKHADNAGPCLAYRIEAEGKTICYSGDTEWTDALIEAARGADLFVCECYMFEKVVRAHLSLSTLREKLPLHRRQARDPHAYERGHAEAAWQCRDRDRGRRKDRGVLNSYGRKMKEIRTVSSVRSEFE